jgi:3-oxoacyl-[acyl-carrier protein] reductase
MKLEDLKIVVSGGAQGMGRHFAQRLAEAGAEVAIGDVNEVGLAETIESTKGAKGKVHARRLRRPHIEFEKCNTTLARIRRGAHGL